MALPSSAIASPSCRIAFFHRLPSQHHSHFMGHVWSCPIYTSFYVRSSTTGPFNELPKLKLQLDSALKKLSGFVPDSVHNFPWKKAESSTMQQLLVLGQKALKWYLVALFISSSSCDIYYSISRNKELLIPFGLFLGCLTANFLKEASQDFFHSKDRGMTWQFLGISCFFVLVKMIAIYCSERQPLLLHTANGGLMQVLWHWISSSQQPEGDHRANFIVGDGSATSVAAN